MQYKNLERAGEIARDLPLLQEARRYLSHPDGVVVVRCDEDEMELPRCVNMNVVNAINLVVNSLRKEVEDL